jgi:hypothetical protein
MSSETVNVNTTQPADWAELARKAASIEGIEWSTFVGLAIVDRAIRVLQLDPVEAWATLPERKRGRPFRYDPAKAPAVKRKRGRANG